ncbi:ExbD/TolR family protein [Marinomonas sp. 2405UD68-3]|uniref:ExbD/TolR family protein n=1 Tax=Marinomonas sp. 2405UD68-3 TaxID=3391835 RepID=UPI0039C9AA8E
MIFVSPPKSSSLNTLDESMIPAINIVFLLLIFFMIAGHIASRSDQLLIPSSSSEMDLARQDVAIKVMANGRYYLNDMAVEITDLPEQLNQLSLSAESKITFRIHKNLPASVMDPILSVIKELGVKQLLLVTEQ